MNNYKMYTLSFYGKQYNSKPTGSEAGHISTKLKPTTLSYDWLARHVGEMGCTFAPSVFNGSRKSENFMGQQLFAIDIDDGANFITIKQRADKYNLSVLFAYKSFSWTAEHEKFRVEFAFDKMITDAFTAQSIIKMFMCIFEESDSHCSDLARLYYGSNKGLLYLAPEAHEISFQNLIIALNCYLCDKYDENHYSSKIRSFYASAEIETNRKVPIFTTTSDGAPIICRADSISKSNSNASPNLKVKRQTSKVDFNVLKERCRLFRDFSDGSEYFYYPELFLLATNLINMTKGKTEFIKILNDPANRNYTSYFTRNWKAILGTLIDMDYKPMSCKSCPHVNNCAHYKNMVLTVNPGKSGIRPMSLKRYCSIEEAEQSLAENFKRAVEADEYGLKIIVAQTGLGKTHMYLNYLKTTKERFLIAAPTHKLIHELYTKALSIGVSNIFCMPEMPNFSDDLKNETQHLYDVGAGVTGLKLLRALYENMKPEDVDYELLGNYLAKLEDAKKFDGHILVTHERFLYLAPDSEILTDRKVIIDEDILRAAFPTIRVDNDDIHKAIENKYFTSDAISRLNDILKQEGYQRYYSRIELDINLETHGLLSDINTNVLDLLNAKAVMNDGTYTTYIKVKQFPTTNAIVLSATANPDIYKWLLYTQVKSYLCKQAKYKGRIYQYTNSSYSRKALMSSENHEELIDSVKNKVGNDNVITFKCIEEKFHTPYHFGGIEGLNCLEGRNISVIGLPNVDEKVYKLYGMLTGIEPENELMQNRKIQYNEHEFYLNTFNNFRLRTIQLWMLESYLEQAVGRARLLRYDCTVKVFARFPIDQAEIL